MYATFCAGCGDWADHSVERGEGLVRLECSKCGQSFTRSMRWVPLFIVTGASGTGKSAVVEELRRLMTDWEVFETDILWDSGGDWQFVRQNWLRIAHSIAQSGRGTILCGTMLPEDVDRCDHRELFSQVHYLNLHCDDATRAARLRARPGCRGCTEEFVAEHEKFARWLLENAETAFVPPLTTIDTTVQPVSEVARQIRNWARARWPGTEAASAATADGRAPSGRERG